ncbi:ABC transporter substrate-binding protein [Nonomuraea dietziae]|uniref:ABC transporter substrate-binding protein n=1 Tax=Nonomuraea dietziae TaxID=65515 RepID=UPI0031D61E98
MKRLAAAVAVLAVTTLAAACGSSPSASSAENRQVRLGYFPNITHATALYGIEKDLYAKSLGVPVTTSTFNAGPAAIEAVFSGAVDATYIGPNPAINAWEKSKGKAINIVAGAASGGVFLVVKPEINSVEDLKGKKIATPQLGNTQDVALRHWLLEKGIKTDTKGGGEVSIVPQENSQTLQTFATGDIDGAWVPEPFASRLVIESKGKILQDERELWPGKQFVITHLIVRQEWAKANPDLLKKLVEAHVQSTQEINADPDAAGRGRQRLRPEADRQAAQARGAGQRVQEHHLHQRPDRLLAHRQRGPRREGRSAQARRPQRHLRPEDPQRGPGRQGPAVDQGQVT